MFQVTNKSLKKSSSINSFRIKQQSKVGESSFKRQATKCASSKRRIDRNQRKSMGRIPKSMFVKHKSAPEKEQGTGLVYIHSVLYFT